MKYLFVLFCLFVTNFTNGQQITTLFDHTVIEEKFESINKTWPQIFNTENIALSQPGHYEMRRINNETGNYIFPSINNKTKSYEVLLNLGFTKNNDKNSIAGILLNSNQKTGSGILFELRNDRSYRISNMTAEGVSYYTNAQEDGWISDKSKVAKKKNILRILTDRKRYDVYINDIFIYTFTELSNDGGDIGLYIGPNSHAYYYSFVLKIQSEKLINSNLENTDVTNLKEIQELKTKVRLQQNEIDRLKAMQQNDANNIAEIKELQNSNLSLNKTITLQNQEKDSLSQLNESLLFFKNSIVDAPEGETILALSKTIQSLREDKVVLTKRLEASDNLNITSQTENKALEAQNRDLKLQISNLNNQISFLIRQIDWMNKKLKSDSTHIIDTLRIQGQGYYIPKHLSLPKGLIKSKLMLEIKKG